MESRPRRTAERSSSLLPCPEQRADLGFCQAYSDAEFEQIKNGFIPEAMEDKWFILYEEPWLYLHRSWTGACIYGVRFERQSGVATAVEAWASRDAQHYTETRVRYDRALLAYLIDAILLGKPVAFPDPIASGLFQHNVVGRVDQESLWGRFKRWCCKRQGE
jgi:hypothetical protein